MRYKCIVSYRGNAYVGFQSQINGLAIQDVIEEKLKIIFREDIRIVIASRTDAHVHAKGQVFHFDAREVDTYKLKGSLNGLLPKDIHIRDIEIVADDFHCRYLSRGKWYRYLINIGEYDPLLDGLAYQCFYKVDVAKMIEASKLFIGKHDFSAFNTTPKSEKEDQVREIYSFDILRKGDLLIIDVKGDGFLRHMVRILVGTLLDVARGRKSISDVQAMLEDKEKEVLRFNIDACGLYLMQIYY